MRVVLARSLICFVWPAVVGAILSCSQAEPLSGDEADAAREGCTPACEVGEALCAAEGLSRCVAEDGCPHFAEPEPCPSGTRCSDAACVGDRGPCVVGERVCAGVGIIECDSAVAGAEWSIVTPCPDGTTCSGGTCVALCFDECAPGTARCQGNAAESCGEAFDGDTCTDWTGFARCPSGTSCSEGVCSTVCEDECAPAETACGGDGTQTCGQTDADACLDLSLVAPCDASMTCSDGVCALVCSDECVLGQIGCASSHAFRQCGRFDADTCLDWSTPTACPDGKSCASGACVATCSEDCSPAGKTECASGAGTRTCGNFDADACLEWSGTVTCPVGQVCQAGVCETPCTDECGPGGMTDCSGGAATMTCGNYDSDSCLEWSAPTSCPVGKVCLSGACGTPCTDECGPAGTTTCSGGSAYKTCGNYDGDGCLEWSSSASCAYGETCTGTSCTAGQPDLQLGLGAYVTYKSSGHTMHGSYSVCNKGTGAAAPFTIGIYFDTGAPTCATTPAHTAYGTELDAGVCGGGPFDFAWWSAAPTTAYVMVDSGCTIAESNESNNTVMTIVGGY